MTAPGSIISGGRITALAARNAVPVAVIKAIDQANSTTTLAADTGLLLPVTASTRYLFACYLNYEGQVTGSGDIKYKWIVPSGATLRYTAIGMTTAGAPQTAATQKESTQYSLGSNGLGTLVAGTMIGTLVTGTTAGTIQLQWAANVGPTTTTTVHAQSFLALLETT